MQFYCVCGWGDALTQSQYFIKFEYLYLIKLLLFLGHCGANITLLCATLKIANAHFSAVEEFV